MHAKNTCFTVMKQCEIDVLSPLLPLTDAGDTEKFYWDNYCLALLLKGVCLRHRGDTGQAEQCFMEVIS